MTPEGFHCESSVAFYDGSSITANGNCRFSEHSKSGKLSMMKALVRQLLRLSALLLACASAGAQPGGVADLPLIELPAASARPYLAVFLTGDGGWAELDHQVSARLVAAGIPVVGWNSLKYYWVQRSPEEAARDLERVLDCYLAKWRKTQAVLVGYSRGADVLPFLASRLPPASLKRVRLVALLGPATSNRFEPLATEYTHVGAQAPALPIAPEVAKLRGMRILGFYGSDETDSLCKGATPGLLECTELSGGHHFGGSYAQIADKILAQL
jgi:type IV secretory pathway VirJ component